MADRGTTSGSGGPHKAKTSSWIAVLLMIAASVVLAFAFILQSIVLGVVGVVVGIAGLVLGITSGMMDDAH